YPLCPYTTLFRSPCSLMAAAQALAALTSSPATGPEARASAWGTDSPSPPSPSPSPPPLLPRSGPSPVSEERRVRSGRAGRWGSVGEDLGQEGLGAVAARGGEELLGLALLDDLALVHV